MSEELVTMLTIFYGIITLIIVAVTIFLTIRNIKKSYSETLLKLERNKNLIISGTILSELNKVESLINNKELEEKYDYWKSIFKEIKDKDVVKITDDLIEADTMFDLGNIKACMAHLAKIDFDI